MHVCASVLECATAVLACKIKKVDACGGDQGHLQHNVHRNERDHVDHCTALRLPAE